MPPRMVWVFISFLSVKPPFATLTEGIVAKTAPNFPNTPIKMMITEAQ